MLKLRPVLAFVLAFLLTVQPAMAWSEGGHHLIAVMAFELLGPKQQHEIQRILKQHPRFGDDFQPPAKVTGHRDVVHWTIGRAGYWPDIARSQPFYNRPSWHYQLGSSLTIGNNVNVPATPGPVSPDATLESKDLHIAQAVELCRSVLRDQSRSDGDRALAICWLAHLVADAQRLHSRCHTSS